MKIISSPIALQQLLTNYKQDQVALVPTMGCLHEGHISLIRKAKQLADIVVVSIYVNPLQFGANEDLNNYPKPFADDAKLCELEGVDIIFHPENLYPEHGIQVGLHVNALSNTLCGASRPGHFDGVVTVVNILFNIIQPNIAVFGEKDFQQLTIISQMVSDLFMPVQIVAAETLRESDGLAKSSRNSYLNKQQRLLAAQIPACLRLMQEAARSEISLDQLLQLGFDHLKKHEIQVDYLGVYFENSLLPATTLDTKKSLRIFIAAPIGPARLIDNMPLHSAPYEDITPCV